MKKSNVTSPSVKEFSDTKSIAEYLDISRMQIYRWNKIVPLPKWHRGYGSRCWEIGAWTKEDLILWLNKLRGINGLRMIYPIRKSLREKGLI